MKKTLLTIFLILAVILTAAFWLIIKEKTIDTQLSQTRTGQAEVQISGKKLSTEVAATPEKRALGLSGREGLCQDCAMLFSFEKPGEYSFWMKDMQFDLDIVWISGDEITGIAKNVSHDRGSAEIVHPPVPVDRVLEINAGASDRLDLKTGDKVEFFKVKP